MRGSSIFVSAIANLVNLSQFIIKEMSVRDIWDDGVFAGLYVVPVISKFLSIPHNIINQNPVLLRQEMCRLGALLYLAGIRQRFGVELHLEIYVSKLKLVLAIPTQDHDVLLSLWLLVLGGVQSFLSEHHGWFVSATADLITRLQYSFWDEVMVALNQVVWIEGLLGAEFENFRMEITSILWEKSEYWLR
ncbi:MAG: hypothetical protein CL912_27570 [Deltaproteobacteria bacterium]|nr:hypothetical protein [Deltaproteobacteria bacterium]|tara:strand:+ start:273 stop:842 length:570 start_codon:yes stop_codon:yes gene_type:complete